MPLYGSGGEWWIRSDDGGYYFLDFLIKESGIVVEYNGHKFHPKHDADEGYGFNGLPPVQVKWALDETRRDTIRNRGYHLIEIWDDDLPDVVTLAEEINELHTRRTSALSAV